MDYLYGFGASGDYSLLPVKIERPIARFRKTVDERFDHDDWLGDALAENMELVRELRSMLPESGRKSETRREAQIAEGAAMVLIDALEAYMKDD